MAEPNLRQGLDYWNTQPATNNGVLGGYGNGSLPRIDALGSRNFILQLIPRLCKVSSSMRKLDAEVLLKTKGLRTRALDVGGGVGRTTKDVLLHLVDQVILLEPVHKFLSVARDDSTNWKGIPEHKKTVTFLEAPLQEFDPLDIYKNTKVLGSVGAREIEDDPAGFDIIWCQWCLGHLSDEDLVAFFKLAQKALRAVPDSFIVVKENLCRDGPDGSPRAVFDHQDSSLTRSDAMWLQIFEESGLRLVTQKLQGGFPSELYKVKMLVLHHLLASICPRPSPMSPGMHFSDYRTSRPSYSLLRIGLYNVLDLGVIRKPTSSQCVDVVQVDSAQPVSLLVLGVGIFV